ncbi:MAG: stage II sporulation protein M [Bacillaceae bacterium]|nr:stage II sporulation protein M [Bacillaceae bacterium]
MKKRFALTLKSYMHEHISLYIFAIVLLAMGVIFGAVVVNSLTLNQKQDLLQYVSGFFLEMREGDGFHSTAAFQQSLGHYLKYIGFMWILGLSIIGLPLILILLFLKGLVVGFTVGFLVHQLQWKGLLYAFVSVVPQNLLVIPAMIVVGVAGISFSMKLIQSRFLQKGERIFPYFVSYSSLVLFMSGIFVIASLFEAFVSPVLLKKVTATVHLLIITII